MKGHSASLTFKSQVYQNTASTMKALCSQRTPCQSCSFTLWGAHSGHEDGVWLEATKEQASQEKILVLSGDLCQSFLRRAGALRKEGVMSREEQK